MWDDTIQNHMVVIGKETSYFLMHLGKKPNLSHSTHIYILWPYFI